MHLIIRSQFYAAAAIMKDKRHLYGYTRQNEQIFLEELSMEKSLPLIADEIRKLAFSYDLIKDALYSL